MNEVRKLPYSVSLIFELLLFVGSFSSSAIICSVILVWPRSKYWPVNTSDLDPGLLILILLIRLECKSLKHRFICDILQVTEK